MAQNLSSADVTRMYIGREVQDVHSSAAGLTEKRDGLAVWTITGRAIKTFDRWKFRGYPLYRVMKMFSKNVFIKLEPM